MNNNQLLVLVWTLAVPGILFLVYDTLHNRATDWLAANDVMHPVYPWWVKLDHWLYHIELTRVSNVLFEQHRFLGSRICVLGHFVTFIR